MFKENINFVRWFESLKRYEQLYIQRLISESCDVTRTTVYLWLKGDVKIKMPYKRIINSLSGLDLFEVG